MSIGFWWVGVRELRTRALKRPFMGRPNFKIDKILGHFTLLYFPIPFPEVRHPLPPPKIKHHPHLTSGGIRHSQFGAQTQPGFQTLSRKIYILTAILANRVKMFVNNEIFPFFDIGTGGPWTISFSLQGINHFYKSMSRGLQSKSLETLIQTRISNELKCNQWVNTEYLLTYYQRNKGTHNTTNVSKKSLHF